MRVFYGPFYALGGRIALDRSKIPEKLRELIPYATFWGMADDKKRDNIVKQAPDSVKNNLKAVMQAYDDLLDEWLAGPEALSDSPTREYIAFSAMRMAADFA
jgi:hypothetical protein